jgi:hypothetical protein
MVTLIRIAVRLLAEVAAFALLFDVMSGDPRQRV